MNRLGIVVPVYGHSKFVYEAVESACLQELDFPCQVVVVDDGCPSHETQRALTSLRQRFPDRVMTLRQANGGLSAARNLGASVLLDFFPDLEAIFFLDSDNRLEPYAMRKFSEALLADPDAAWAFPDINAFGLTPLLEAADVRETAIADDPFRHLRGNICEAGSLVRASVFRSGKRYDEAMKLGLEDWEFWLSLREAGLRGVRVPDSGFLYRVRPESMVALSRRKTGEIVAGMRRKHSKLFSRANVLSLEHSHAPRFLVVDLDDGSLSLTSDPCAPGRAIGLGELRELFRSHIDAVYEVAFPRYVVISHGLQPRERDAYLRSLLFDVLSQKTDTPVVVEIRGSDHASRFFGDIRHARRTFENAEGVLVIVPALALYKLALSEPSLAGLGAIRDVGRLEHWTVPHAARHREPRVPRQRRMRRLAAFMRTWVRPPSVGILSHPSRAYRGPTPQDTRAYVTDELCGYESVAPFPHLPGAAARCLVSVDVETQSDEPSRRELNAFIETLSGLSRVTLHVEGQTRSAHLAGMPGVENVALNSLNRSPNAHFAYMGNRIPVLDSEFHPRSMALARGHDMLVCFGSSVFLTIAGEAKSDGVLTLSVVPDSCLAGPNSAALLSALVAYEHAVHAFVAGPAAARLLAARGVPDGKIIPLDTAAYGLRRLLTDRNLLTPIGTAA